MKISKIRDVKTPIRSLKKDAGIDFYMPKLTNKFIDDLEKKNKDNHFDIIDNGIIVYPHSAILIPSGIKINVPEGLALVFFNKSGISTETGFLVGAEVIDEAYQGEVHIHLINTSKKSKFIKVNRKIIQGLILQVGHDPVEEVPLEELYDKRSYRGEGGFGHTDDRE